MDLIRLFVRKIALFVFSIGTDCMIYSAWPEFKFKYYLEMFALKIGTIFSEKVHDIQT